MLYYAELCRSSPSRGVCCLPWLRLAQFRPGPPLSSRGAHWPPSPPFSGSAERRAKEGCLPRTGDTPGKVRGPSQRRSLSVGVTGPFSLPPPTNCLSIVSALAVIPTGFLAVASPPSCLSAATASGVIPTRFAAATSPPSYSSARHDCAASNPHRICGRNLSPHPISSASVLAVISTGLTAVMPGVGGYRSRRNQKENPPPLVGEADSSSPTSPSPPRCPGGRQ